MADGSGQLLAAVGCRSEPSPNGQVFVWMRKEHRVLERHHDVALGLCFSDDGGAADAPLTREATLARNRLQRIAPEASDLTLRLFGGAGGIGVRGGLHGVAGGTSLLGGDPAARISRVRYLLAAGHEKDSGQLSTGL